MFRCVVFVVVVAMFVVVVGIVLCACCDGGDTCVDDIDDGCFKDETIGHREGFWQHRNRRDFKNKTMGQFSQRVHFCHFMGHEDVDGDLDSIKLQIPTFLGKNDPETFWNERNRWIGFFIAITIRYKEGEIGSQ